MRLGVDGRPVMPAWPPGLPPRSVPGLPPPSVDAAAAAAATGPSEGIPSLSSREKELLMVLAEAVSVMPVKDQKRAVISATAALLPDGLAKKVDLRQASQYVQEAWIKVQRRILKRKEGDGDQTIVQIHLACKILAKTS